MDQIRHRPCGNNHLNKSSNFLSQRTYVLNKQELQRPHRGKQNLKVFNNKKSKD